MNERDDAEILEDCKNGSRTAFNELVRKYQERIYWSVQRMVQNHDDAMDIAQDVFVRAFQKLDAFRGESQFFTWLYRIAMNMSLNHLRKRKLRSFVSLDDNAERMQELAVNNERSLEESEITDLIDNAIALLPEKQKMVFILRYYDEMPYEEMAKVLNKSTGGLKANYFHAVKKVQEYVKNAM